MEKEKMMTVGDLVIYLCSSLNCNNKIVAGFVGLDESYLKEDSRERPGVRLKALYAVIRHFVNQGVSSVTIKESLNEFVFEDLDGNYDSVISALIADKYNQTVLLNIGKLGLERYLKKLALRDAPPTEY